MIIAAQYEIRICREPVAMGKKDIKSNFLRIKKLFPTLTEKSEGVKMKISNQTDQSMKGLNIYEENHFHAVFTGIKGLFYEIHPSGDRFTKNGNSTGRIKKREKIEVAP